MPSEQSEVAAGQSKILLALHDPGMPRIWGVEIEGSGLLVSVEPRDIELFGQSELESRFAEISNVLVRVIPGTNVAGLTIEQGDNEIRVLPGADERWPNE